MKTKQPNSLQFGIALLDFLDKWSVQKIKQLNNSKVHVNTETVTLMKCGCKYLKFTYLNTRPLALFSRPVGKTT